MAQNAKKRKTELLLPAKDLEVLKTAVRYGADAVYIGGERTLSILEEKPMAFAPRRGTFRRQRWQRGYATPMREG